ncbi:MAG: hypothetical protein ACO3CQ_02465 [Candidatus Nanopelagicaceae bacterium]
MATETLLPNELVSSVNLNVTLANVDEGVSNPDNVWATTQTNNANTSLVLGFPTPTAQLTTGEGLQTFRARVRKNDNTGTNNTTTVRLEVYENGSPTGTVGPLETITATGTGIDITFTWDASILANIDGSNVQIGIIQQAGGTGNPSGRRRWIEIDTADWIADYTPPAGNNARSFAVFI